MKVIIRDLLIFNFLPFLLSLLIFSEIEIKKSIFWGWLVVFTNIGIGLIAFEISKKLEDKHFLKVYLGGMVIRMFMLLSLIFIILKYIGINPIGFLFSLFIFYFINQFIELKYIIKVLTNK